MNVTNTRPKTSRRRHNVPRRPPAVRLEFRHPTATRVCVAGSFNDWHPAATEMIDVEAGRWVKALSLPPGNYEYLLVVDDEWIPDPAASAYVPNPFGGSNSVLVVPEDRSGDKS